MTGSQSSEQFDYLIQAQVRQADLIACKTLQDSLQQAALQSKGYLGQETFCRQLENGFIEYNVRLRFSEIQSCLAWIDSPIRRRYLHQAESRFVHQFRSGIHKPSFDLWLTAQLPDPPPIWKMNLLVWWRSNSVGIEETSKRLKRQPKNTVFLQFFEVYSILAKFERTKLIFSFLVLNFWSLNNPGTSESI